MTPEEKLKAWMAAAEKGLRFATDEPKSEVLRVYDDLDIALRLLQAALEDRDTLYLGTTPFDRAIETEFKEQP